MFMQVIASPNKHNSMILPKSEMAPCIETPVLSQAPPAFAEEGRSKVHHLGASSGDGFTMVRVSPDLRPSDAPLLRYSFGSSL